MLHSAKAIEQEIIRWRRTIHQNPELSFQEFQTSAFIQKTLAELNIPFKVMAKTGVVAHIGQGDRCVALRADIDALPIQEETGLPFASQNAGVMHACGHDAHTAMLLGAAKLLKEREKELGGIVKLIFQPGEEKVPGGASMMIAEGVLDHPRPEVIFGQHANPDAPAGTAAFVSGAMMASADELYWTIHGKSGHAAQPHLAIDPVFASAAMIVQLQSLVSRRLNPFEPGVFSVTSIHGGHATNVIPEAVELMGTLRSMNEEWREFALETIGEQSEAICRGLGARADFRPLRGYPPLINNGEATEFAAESARVLLGDSRVQPFEPKMWGEDFAFYAKKIPACFWMLGVRSPSKNKAPGLHNCRFEVDESALAVGTALFLNVAVARLKS